MYKIYITILLIIGVACGISKEIPYDRILSDEEILDHVDEDFEELSSIFHLRNDGEEQKALIQFTSKLKNRIAERYYFNWNNFNDRFEEYRDAFPEAMKKHEKLALYHKSTFSPETSWELPFQNLKNEEVTAYELRHLARQQKSFSMALMYFNGDAQDNLDYFVRQVADLNRAFSEGTYDDEGNGIYEVYRAGRRIHNWLFCHNVYLNMPEYGVKEQLLLIRVFLHHGAQLYKRTKKNKYGNHHTRGLVALFEISTLFPEFKDSEKWQKQAVKGLTWHIENEINMDGFQLERSVHYHKGDIENYFRVYQLAEKNNVKLPEIFVEQFRKMFESLVLLAQPNKRLPVLQDDTDNPFTENNSMDDALTIGTIVFKDPSFRYFSTNKIPGSVYWLLGKNQLTSLDSIEGVNPEIGSVELEQTGYYVTRNGWEKSSNYMTITAGLSEKKPDHQHGDMLGVVAYANGHEILPNYQVRYKYPDYIYWKNSWVKNVALVDSITHGRRWKANRGKSGFGKWLFLPDPKVISWTKTDKYDHFIGSHNGFDTVGVSYFREVLFLHDGFWIVGDHFESSGSHNYQQVWQGTFSSDSASEIKKVFEDGSGMMIKQLMSDNFKISNGGKRDKNNSVFSVGKKGNYSFLTLLKPFGSDGNRTQKINPDPDGGDQWVLQKQSPDFRTDASLMLTKFNTTIVMNCTYINYGNISLEIDTPATMVLESVNEGGEILYLGRKDSKILKMKSVKELSGTNDHILFPGEKVGFN